MGSVTGETVLDAKILVVDDDPQIRETLEAVISSYGCRVNLSADGEEALAAIKEDVYDVIFLDYRIPKIDGISVLRETMALYPDCAVVLITGEGSEDVARDAFKMGAFDYVVKPFRKIDDLQILIGQAIERQQLRRDNAELRRQNEELRDLIDRKYTFKSIVGNTKEMRKIFDLIERVASTKSTVLITGESGTGKELIAKALHFHSDRKDKPFVSVNCGALPDNLLEDELFGHIRGAFTDAIGDRMGRFELAHQGTLFLDEIGNMSQNLQVKLLRVLQEREITPLGSTRRVEVDVRIIAATNTDLREMIEHKRFRNDLFYRLNVITIRLPSLQERRADIPLLISHFLGKYCQEMNLPRKTFSSAAVRELLGFSWPGNVRQLENVVERGVALSGPRAELDVEDLPEEITRSGKIKVPPIRLEDGGINLENAVSDFEGKLVLQALESTDWVKTKAARLLTIKRTTLIEKMKRLGIPLKNGRAEPVS
ncbi:MAG TPA: sigma-54 dependent transcriptional regulator [Candidatus Polarisedimenticolia bacterium]|nr:sigma-54 dependent transcriptional regulator [Candidatus Polarisedimenticolia bacterium]